MIKSLDYVLRISVDSRKGGRKYMEDDFAIAYQSSQHLVPSNSQVFDYVYFGVFDGHGGKEAANYTKHHLLDNIFKQDYFWSGDDELVLKAIKAGFIATHMAMIKEVVNWPKTPSGLPSTAGTTASVLFLMNHKYYVGHVGDSRIVLGRQDVHESYWIPHSFTEDHKPDCPLEKKRIEEAGGKVLNKAGVDRVVWYRPTQGHQGPIRRSTHFEEIPFLAVARSLGDLWSYNSVQNEYIVSPEPDLCVFPMNFKTDKCIVLASDGLWNVMRPLEVMLHLQEVQEKELDRMNKDNLDHNYNNTHNFSFNQIYHKEQLSPAQTLVESALERWESRHLRADNTTAIVIYLDHLAFLNCKQNEQKGRVNIRFNNRLTPIILSGSESSYVFNIDEHQPFLPNLEVESVDDLLPINITSQTDHSFSILNTSCQCNSESDFLKHEVNSKRTSISKPDIWNKTLDSNLQKALKPKDDNRIGNRSVFSTNAKNTKSKMEETQANHMYSDSISQETNENKVSNSQNCFPKSITQLTSKYISLNHKRSSNQRSKPPKRRPDLYSPNSSPPSKRLRSKSKSKARFQAHVRLTKALAASLMTKSRLRTRYFKPCK